MRELSLFTGAGGGVYGSKLLGWQTVGYVEWDEYCQKIIAQRIRDGIFDQGPIFSDVRQFVESGAAERYRGFVDVVSGGFPCQPFSVAGKRAASEDERDMWPATLDVIKAIKPAFVFLENVAGLLSATMDDQSGRPVYYFGTILRDLAQVGYNVKWCMLGADDIGANHKRKRLWMLGSLANADSNGRQSNKSQRGNHLQSEDWPEIVKIRGRSSSLFPDPIGSYSKTRSKPVRQKAGANPDRCGSRAIVADTKRQRTGNEFKNKRPTGTQIDKPWHHCSASRGNDRQKNRESVPHTLRDGLQGRWQKRGFERPPRLCRRERCDQIQNVFDYTPECSSWWDAEPLLGRVANGVADRSNRLKAIGNGQVSLAMATAFSILFSEFIAGGEQ